MLQTGEFQHLSVYKYQGSATYQPGFSVQAPRTFSHTLNNCIRRQLLPADISQFLWAVIIRRYRLSATSVRILDIIKMSG